MHFWSDTGPHFRSHEYVHYVLKEFPAKVNNGCRVDLNYLTKKHGKNQRDTHFRSVCAYTSRAARNAKKVISTVSELKDALTRAHADVQAMNKTLKLPAQSGTFYLLNMPVAGTYVKKTMDFSDLACVYAMRVEGDQLYAYKDSTYTSRVLLAYECTAKPCAFKLVTPPIRTPLTATQLTKTLKRRRVAKLALYANAEECEGSDVDNI